ncbi:MAG: hypothetical protein ABW072_14380 [Sedimenticola sp.]
MTSNIAIVNNDDLTLFITKIRPEGLLKITVIEPIGGRPQTQCFKMPKQLEAAREWVKALNSQGGNAYYELNIPKQASHTRSKERDIEKVIGIVVDIDPPKELPYRDGRKKIKEDTLQRVMAHPINPSIIVDSGNGIQCIYLLSIPSDNLELAKEISQRLATLYGGDSTVSVEHLFRLPGTLNYPSQAKLKRGYPNEPTYAMVLEITEARYTLEELAKDLPPLPPSPFGGVGAIPISASNDDWDEDTSPLSNDEIQRLIKRLERDLQKHTSLAIRWQGNTSGLNDTSRSGMDMSVATHLKALGYTFREARYLLIEIFKHGAGAEKAAANDERYFRRLWTRSSVVSTQSIIDKINCIGTTDPAAVAEVIASSGLSAAEQERAITHAANMNVAGKRALTADIKRLKADALEKQLTQDTNTIIFEAASLPEIVDTVDKHFASMDPPHVFRRGNGFCRLQVPSPDTVQSISNPDMVAPIIEKLDATMFVDIATRELNFYRNTDKGHTPIACPREVAQTYLTRGDQSEAKPLIAVTQTPLMRPDGTILNTPGHDPSTGIYLTNSELDSIEIPEAPSKEQALEALAILMEPFQNFPFVSDESKSVVLAAVLTAISRPIMRSSPMFLLSATKMGTGKSLLASCVSLIAQGNQSPRVMSYVDNEEEMRKRLFAICLQGNSIVSMDNVSQVMESDSLCIALTEPTLSDRILGKSETHTVPTTTTFLVTGNALRVRGDLSTRSLIARLDAKIEHPEKRRFDRNLFEWIPAHRGELVTAALTILRAYQVAEAQVGEKLTPWGRFEDWSRYIREPIVWLGLPDPVSTTADIQSFDPAREELAELLRLWYNVFGNHPVSTKEVINKVELIPVQKPSDPPNVEIENCTALKELLLEIPLGRLNGRKLAGYLRRNNERIEGGYFVRNAGERNHAALWQVCVAE